MPKTEPFLRIEGLCKSYASPSGESIDVLRDIDLTIAAGDSLALTGPSGSGKSTLLHVLGLLLKPSAGSIHFNGTDLSHLSPQKGNQWRAEHLGFVFQKHLLLPELNLLENTCLPLAKSKGWSREVLQRGEEVLKNLGLEHRINALPSKLSGGEAQRGAIARALVHHPTLLLLDEPTGNLDPSMSTELMKQILSISKSKGITCITVTHNLELAQTMDRHGRMLDHRLVE